MRQRRATQSGLRATSSRLARAVLIFWFSSRQRLLLYVRSAPPFGGVQSRTAWRIEGGLDAAVGEGGRTDTLLCFPLFAVAQRATFLEK